MTDVERLDHARPRHAGSKPRTRSRALFLLITALLLVPLLGAAQGVPFASGDDLSDALAKQRALQQKIASQKAAVAQLNSMQSDLQGLITSTNQILGGVNADLVVVQAKIGKMAAEIAKVRAAYNSLVQQLAQLDQQLIDTEAQEAAKQAQLEERKVILGQRLQAAYSTGEQSLLETVLSAESFSDALADVGYYLDIGDQDKALAGQIEADQQTLAAIHQSVLATRQQTDVLRLETGKQKKALDARIADLRAAQAKLSQLQAQIRQQLAAQRAAYAKLVANKARLASTLASAVKAQASLKRKIDELVAAQFQYGNVPSVYNGTLIWPLNGTITQPFGCTGFAWEPPLGNCAHFHNGIDIAAAYGSPIVAAGPGQVVYAGPLYDPVSAGAWVVIIAHSASLQTWYAHVQTRLPVHTGDTVSQGQLIAYVGMTGNSTGPHLHWMVELNGTFVNPRLFV